MPSRNAAGMKTRRGLSMIALLAAFFVPVPESAAAQLYDFNRFFTEPHPFSVGRANAAYPSPPPAYRPQFVPTPARMAPSPASRVVQSRPGAPKASPPPRRAPARPAFERRPPENALSDFYGAFNLIGSYGTVDDVSITGGGPLTINNDSDIVAAFGIALGYEWSKLSGLPLRSELEYHYRVRMDFDARDTGTAGTPGYENDLASHVVLFNLYYDWVLSPRWTVYGGAGIGMAQNSSSVDRVNLTTGAKTSRTDSKTGLAWNVGLGALWRIRPRSNWTLDLRYRYIDLGEVSSGPHVGGEKIAADKYVSHDLVIGIIYDF